MGFSRQEYWSGLPFPPGDLPNPGIEPRSPTLQADFLPSEPPRKPIKSVKCFKLSTLSKNIIQIVKLFIIYPIRQMTSESRSVVSNSLQPHGLHSPWHSPGQNTRVGSLSLLQGIFPTQPWNPGLLHCRLIFQQLSHKGNPRTLEWVAYPFSSTFSQPKNWIRWQIKELFWSFLSKIIKY